MTAAFPALHVRYAPTRDALHRVAAHILGRRRFAVTGRFGLRVTPSGFATPAFGDDVEVVRVTPDALLHERGTATAVQPLRDATLDTLAAFVGVTLSPDFAVGSTTPPLDDTGTPLGIDAHAAAQLADWFGFGARALDAALTALGPDADATVVQLWPEHFDVACDVAAGATRVNLGASPGDNWFAEPYVYVGPHDLSHTGTFWNAPFGAVLLRDEFARSTDPLQRAAAFLCEGVERASRN